MARIPFVVAPVILGEVLLSPKIQRNRVRSFGMVLFAARIHLLIMIPFGRLVGLAIGRVAILCLKELVTPKKFPLLTGTSMFPL
jgi:hypothetical protein